jgi:hypothetical protein
MGWGRIKGGVKVGGRVDKKGQQEYLGRRTMDCSTGEGGRVKEVRVGMKR